ncbi:potassium channel protein [Candidatus Bathyarchaeota archaeon]|nr:potassium channel protein [Candidatus Bathyarchaeota archaeon]
MYRKERIRYRPISVREILLEMKNLSELMIDLAYSAALFNDKDLAEDVIELEEKVDTLAFLLDMEIMIAARDAEDARILSGIAKIASAADKISDAAGDIAAIVLRGIGVHPIISDIFERAEERLIRIKVPPDSPVVGARLIDLDPASMGMDIIAIHRNRDWIINPKNDEKIMKDDILIVRGVSAGINEFRSKIGDKQIRYEGPALREFKGEKWFRDIVERFVELKDTSELMIALAYSALVMNSRELAEEVYMLEEHVDRMHTDFELLVLSSKLNESDVRGILGLIRLALAAEKISDAAAEIAEVILRGIEPHPVIKIAIRDAEETVAYVRVSESSPLVNKMLKETRIPEETGMRILAIKRGDKCMRPKPDTRIEAGDILIASGYSGGREDLIKLAAPEFEFSETNIWEESQ